MVVLGTTSKALLPSALHVGAFNQEKAPRFHREGTFESLVSRAAWILTTDLTTPTLMTQPPRYTYIQCLVPGSPKEVFPSSLHPQLQQSILSS